ncbi:MAG: putative ATPase, partial [Parasphingorhabdus sp.]
MSIPDEGRYPPIELSAEQQKFLLLTALCKQLFSLADQKPVLCIFEDLQWIDHTTLEYIDFMLSQIQSRRIFVILTYRPGFEPKWIGEANVTIVNINKLPASLSNSLIANITGNKPLPKEVIEKIVEKTDGIPLFVEELTKTILTSGMLTETEVGYELAGELKNLSIPNTLHDSLMSRLDRLGSAKNVAQIGAAIGRVFNHELIRLLTAYSEQVLQNELTKLLDAGLIFQRGTGPDTDYTFNHALIQDTAYESLLKSRRQTLHGEIANTMVDHFPGRLDIEPEIAAHYFFRAGQTVSAIKYCLRAGIRANKRSASVEAINHLTSAMDGFADLDPTSHDDKLKLDVMVQRVAPTIAVKGYSAPELQNLYPEILKIGSKLGDTPQIFPALYVHWVSVWTTDNLSSALDYAKDFHKLAREQNSTSASITAERITATV